jgi:hypothetical protein
MSARAINRKKSRLGINSFLKERKIGAINKLAGVSINMISLARIPNLRPIMLNMTNIKIKTIKYVFLFWITNFPIVGL